MPVGRHKTHSQPEPADDSKMLLVVKKGLHCYGSLLQDVNTSVPKIASLIPKKEAGKANTRCKEEETELSSL